MKKYIYCYSKKDFDTICNINDWSDDNPPNENTIALISICSTADVVQNVICSPDNHFFEKNRKNILNLNFDDIDGKEQDIEGGGKAYGITKDQALQIVKFVRDNIEKVQYFFIHCRAGQSRSQAVVRYILDTYSRIYELAINPDNPPNTPNPFVLSRLKQAEKIILEEIRLNFIDEGYTVESFVSDIYGGNWAVIKIKEIEYEIYYWPNNGTTHIGKWVWGKDDNVYEADDYNFWNEIRKFVKK